MSRRGDHVAIFIPADQIHGLRVLIDSCNCRATRSAATVEIRDRLSRGLAKLEAKT